MAMKTIAACPGGHLQTHVRPDRPGRCTTCGGALVASVYDDALPQGLTMRDSGFVEGTIEHGKFVRTTVVI